MISFLHLKSFDFIHMCILQFKLLIPVRKKKFERCSVFITTHTHTHTHIYMLLKLLTVAGNLGRRSVFITIHAFEIVIIIVILYFLPSPPAVSGVGKPSFTILIFC